LQQPYSVFMTNHDLAAVLLLQDAVMQQFFGLVDTLLAGSPGAKQRRLGYRTYRVVPCSPLVGVLEWVEGTTPLTEYLLGDRSNLYSGGASARSVLPQQGQGSGL
jgi:ataxia telangiectasia mutated family protein